jgi:hypothetical protein
MNDNSIGTLIRAQTTGDQVLVRTLGMYPGANGTVDELTVVDENPPRGHVQVGSASVPLHIIEGVEILDER